MHANVNMMGRGAYEELCRRFQRHTSVRRAAAFLQGEQLTTVPPKGQAASAAVFATLQRQTNAAFQKPDMPQLLFGAHSGRSQLTDEEQASFREMCAELQVDFNRNRPVSQAMNKEREEAAAAKARATGHSMKLWRECRSNNDWETFAPVFQEVLTCLRRSAKIEAELVGVTPYDNLLDYSERGLKSTQVDEIYDELRTWLPEAYRAEQQRQSKLPPLVEEKGGYDAAAQERLSKLILDRLGFDWSRGRMSVSVHPMSGDDPDDLLIATMQCADQAIVPVYATFHEGTHARYEQSLPSHLRGLPVGESRSRAVQESQAIMTEQFLVRSRPFQPHLSKLLTDAYGTEPAFEVENLQRFADRVRLPTEGSDVPAFMDDLGVQLALMTRYDLERMMLDGDVDAKDLPTAWDTVRSKYFDTKISAVNEPGMTVLKDTQWIQGVFGYYPAYTVGLLYAAQLHCALRDDLGDHVIDTALTAGDFSPIVEWQAEHVWRHGRVKTTERLIHDATKGRFGKPGDPAAYTATLKARYNC